MSTIVGSPGAGRTIAGRERALAGLAFATRSVPATSGLSISRHLAFLPPDELSLDLANAEERDFGDYELIELLGQGGMGVVYRARQKSLARDVAVKLLAAGPWASAEFIARFEREAQHAAQLNHPNIVPIFEIGEHEGLHFFSMALVRGTTLAAHVAKHGQLAPRDAARIVRVVAEALSYAHALGVLHLDLKPGNVLIDERGAPLVADFGLARRLDQALGIESDEVSGTPSYMAPEQAQLKSHPLSPATDIWGLGAILYECLTGVPPFLGATPRETLMEVVAGTAERPRARDARIPLDLEAIVLKCLAKEPRERYADARDLADDLGRFVEGRAVRARTQTRRERTVAWVRRNPALATFATLFLAALIGGLVATTAQWRRADAATAAVRETLWRSRLDLGWRDLLDERPLDALPGLVANLGEQERIGDMVAANATRTRIAAAIEHAPRLIDVVALQERLTASTYSRDGATLFVGSESGRVHAIDTHTGAVRWRAETAAASHFWPDPSIRTLRTTPDGSRIVATRMWPNTVMAPGGFDEILLDAGTGALDMPAQGQIEGFTDATLAPDGTHAVVRTKTPDGERFIRMYRTGDWTPLSSARDIGRGVPLQLVSAGGRHVATSGSSLREIELRDGATLERRFVREIDPGRDVRVWAFSPDGGTLALGSSRGLVALVDTLAGTVRTLDDRIEDEVRAISFSEDGAWVATAWDGGQAVVHDVASGSRIAEPVDAGTMPRSLVLDRGRKALFSQGVERARVFRLEPGNPAATLVADRPAHPIGYMPRGTAIDFAHGAMAGVLWNGEVRFWRIPPDRAATPGAPALEPHGFLRGSQVVAARGSAIELVDPATGEASATIPLPGPVGLVSAPPGGATIAATVGGELHLLDADRGITAASVALPASATRLLAADSGAVIVGWLDRRDGATVEVLQHYGSDARLRAEATLPGPQDKVRLSPDERTVAAVRYGVVELLDAATLAPLGRATFGPDVAAARAAVIAEGIDSTRLGARAAEWTGTPVMDLAFERDSRALWVTTLGDTDTPRLVRLDARSARVLETRALHDTALRVLPFGNGAVALHHGFASPIASLPDGATRLLSGQPDNLSTAFAASADGLAIALGQRDGAALIDMATGAWLTPSLRAGLAGDNFVASVEFARDASMLVAWTPRGRYAAWRVAREERTHAELEVLLKVMHPDVRIDRQLFAAPLDPAVRRALRDGDPGPPAPRAAERSPIAHAPEAVDPRFVALGDRCSHESIAFFLGHETPRIALSHVFPLGRHRLLGVDFDVRCALALSMDNAKQRPARIEDIAVPQPRFAALHLLMTGTATLQGAPLAPYAFVEFRYEDGGSERVPLVYGVDIVEWWADRGDAARPAVAYASHGAARAQHGYGMAPRFFAPRVANPHPARAVRSLALEASKLPWAAPLVLAITLEPADPPRTAGTDPGVHGGRP